MLDFIEKIDLSWIDVLVKWFTETSSHVKCPFLWVVAFVVGPAVVVLLLLAYLFGDSKEKK